MFVYVDESEAASITKDRKKPMYLKDYDRERLMKRGVYVILHLPYPLA